MQVARGCSDWHGSPAHPWSQPGHPWAERDKRVFFPRAIQVLSSQEGEIEKAQVKQLLLANILNLVLPAPGSQSVTREEAPWLALANGMVW